MKTHEDMNQTEIAQYITSFYSPCANVKDIKQVSNLEYEITLDDKSSFRVTGLFASYLKRAEER